MIATVLPIPSMSFDAQESEENTHESEQLTSSYKTVEYIESNGTQFIDTQLYVNHEDSAAIHLDQQFLNVDNRGDWACANGYLQFTPDYVRHKNRSVFDITYNLNNDFCENIYDNGKLIFHEDWREYLLMYDEIALFGLGDYNKTMWNSARNCQHARIFGCSIEINGVVLRDFVPVVNTATGEAGLFDKISQSFFGSYNNQSPLGYKSLPDGEEEYFEDEFFVVPYVESDGIAYIDTRVAVDSEDSAALRYDMQFSPANMTYNSTWSGANWLLQLEESYVGTFDRVFVDCEYNFKGDFCENVYTNKIPTATDMRRGSFSNVLIYVFALGNYDYGTRIGSVTSGQRSKFYGGTVEVNGKTLRDFVPVVSAVTGEAGLFDRVSQCFFGNARGGRGVIYPGIPEELSLLEYLSFSGNEYIDTGISGGATWVLDAKWNVTNAKQLNGYANVSAENFGVLSDGNYTFANIPAGKRDVITYRYENSKTAGISFGFSDISGNTHKESVASLTFRNVKDTTFSLGSLAVNSSYPCKYDVYSLKAFRDGKLIAYYVPCARKYDRMPGVYDVINNRFIMNTGPGAFENSSVTDLFFKDKSEFNPDTAVFASEYFNDLDAGETRLGADGFMKISEWLPPDDTSGLYPHTAPYALFAKEVGYLGNTYRLYMLMVDGTGGDNEWLSNITIGNGADGLHEGFKKGAEFVREHIKNCFEEDPLHNIIIICGYSRGAAVASILAADLSDSSDCFSRDNVAAYVQACPNYSLRDRHYDNIFQVGSIGDPITLLPSADWGYHKEGVVISLPTDKKTLTAMRKYFAEYTSGKPNAHEFNGFTTDVSEDVALLSSVVDVEMLKSGKNTEFITHLLMVYLGEEELSSKDVLSALTVLNPDITMARSLKIATFLLQAQDKVYDSHIHYTYRAWTRAYRENYFKNCLIDSVISYVGTEEGAMVVADLPVLKKDFVYGKISNVCDELTVERFSDMRLLIKTNNACDGEKLLHFTVDVENKDNELQYRLEVIVLRLADGRHVFDNEEIIVAPSCTEDGLKKVCETLTGYYETHVVNASGHTPGETKNENLVPATYDEEGSYDEVVYCDTCGKELSRTNITLPITHGSLLLSVPDVDGAYGHEFTFGITATQLSGNGGVIHLKTDVLTILSVSPASKKTTVTVVGNEIEIVVADAVNDGEKIVDISATTSPEIQAGHYDYVSLIDETNTALFGQLRIYEPGDVNMDGKINSRDAVLIQQYAVKMIQLSDIQLIYANVSGDDKVNSRDAVLIQQYAVKIPVNLKRGGY